jgi:hypothetical protein
MYFHRPSLQVKPLHQVITNMPYDHVEEKQCKVMYDSSDEEENLLHLFRE